jgi:cell division protein FtsI/penicillin-binding protein 2
VPERRSSLTRRGRVALRVIPLVVAAVVAFVIGAAKGGNYEPGRDAAERFVTAWERSDFPAMYNELSKASKKQYTEKEFSSQYLDAAQTATVDGLTSGKLTGPGRFGNGEAVSAPIVAKTRAFGEISGRIVLPLDDQRIAWGPNLVFLGLQPGQHLERRSQLPPRAAILTRDGAALASGPAGARTSPLGGAAIDVAGQVGRPDSGQAAALNRAGFPKDALAGVSGLEKAFNAQLAGQPGGDLLAASGKKGGGERLLGRGSPKAGPALKTTIRSDLQTAAVNALAGRGGGIAVLDAQRGDVLAFAGSAFSVPQPPGSTFKMITTVAALEGNLVKLDDQFPYVTSVNVGGREINNAHKESCGGTFVRAFADSCNSVFAPLGVKVGSERLVATAQRFGFNSRPQLYNAAATTAANPPASTIPTQIGSDLEIGVTAIGQGKVLATPLELASIAQALGTGGMRSPTSIVTDPALGPAAKPVRVTSESHAVTMRRLMLEVVNSGTGTLAGLPGIAVAGKTGTAELGPKPQQSPVLGPDGKPLPVQPEPKQILDAWFAAFAPAKNPKLAVCVLLTNADADGGQVAAPVAREVLAAGLLR